MCSYTISETRFNVVTWGGIIILILTLLSERIVFTIIYNVSANRFDYGYRRCATFSKNNSALIKEVHFKEYFSVHYGYLFNLVSFISPILGGIVGDAAFGRFWTMILGSLFYIVGTVLFEVMLNNICTIRMQYACVYVISIAVSLMLTNVIVLGAHQAERVQLSITTYFLLVYGAWSLGHTIGNVILLYCNVYKMGWISISLSLLWLLAIIIYFHWFKKDKPHYNLIFRTLQSLVRSPAPKIVFNSKLEATVSMKNAISQPSNDETEGRVAIEKIPINRHTSDNKVRTAFLFRTLSFNVQLLPLKKEKKVLSWSWMIKMLPLYTIFGLYILALIDCSYDYPSQYAENMKNKTLKENGWDIMHSNAKVMTVYFLAMAITNVLLFICLRWTRRILLIQQLLQPPLCRVIWSLLVLFVALILSISQSKSSDGGQLVTYKVLIPQIVLSGSSEALGCAAGFEIAYMLSPKQLSSLSLGLLKTMWGLGFLVSLILQYYFAERLHWKPSLKIPQQASKFLSVYCILSIPVICSFAALCLLIVFLRKRYNRILYLECGTE